MTLSCPILLVFSLVALASSRTASARAPSIALYMSSACCSVANITNSKRMHKQKIKESKCSPLFFGRGDKIRTCDFYVPNVALYQAEPHLDGGFFVIFCKWSNMWSDLLNRDFYMIGHCLKGQYFQGFSAFGKFAER